jgi:hypothetical protein
MMSEFTRRRFIFITAMSIAATRLRGRGTAVTLSAKVIAR